jgi:hypothetical protein
MWAETKEKHAMEIAALRAVTLKEFGEANAARKTLQVRTAESSERSGKRAALDLQSALPPIMPPPRRLCISCPQWRADRRTVRKIAGFDSADVYFFV